MISYQITPQRIVLYAILVLAGILGLMAGITIQRRSASDTLLEDQRSLEENLSARETIEQEQIQLLEDELAGIEEQISEYQDRLASLETFYPVFSQTRVLSNIHDVEIISISREGADNEDTPGKTLTVKTFSIELEGNLKNCIDLLSGIEQDSNSTISLNEANFIPGEKSCSFLIQTAGSVP